MKEIQNVIGKFSINRQQTSHKHFFVISIETNILANILTKPINLILEISLIYSHILAHQFILSTNILNSSKIF